MAALIPPVSRPRIHSVSTGIRPPLSLSTLARSPTSSSCAKHPADDAFSDQSCCSSDSCTPSSTGCPSTPVAFVVPPLPDSKGRSETTRSRYKVMFPIVVSRTIELWRAVLPGGDRHATNLFSSTGSSPRSSTETEYILPLSASPQKTSFDSVELEIPSRSRAFYRLLPFPLVHSSLFFVILLFPISSAIVFFSLSSLPITFAWPRTLSDLAQLGRSLSAYSQSGLVPTAHIISVLAVSAVWKHAWSVPGSVLWNVLAGALFHPFLATILMTFLTTIGSVFATLLATPLAPVLTRIFPRPVELTRAALEGSSISSASGSVQSEDFKTYSVTSVASAANTSPAWVRLSILRLVGIVPWSALNIACGLTGVGLRDCITGAFIGCLPWTAVTCQIGDILQAVNKVHSVLGAEEGISKSATVSSVLAQPSMIFELLFLTVLSLAPIIFRERLRKLVPSTSGEMVEVAELEESEEKDSSTNASGEDSSRELVGTVNGDKEEGLDANENAHGRGRRANRQRWTWQRVSMSIPRWSALDSSLRSTFSNIEHNSHR